MTVSLLTRLKLSFSLFILHRFRYI